MTNLLLPLTQAQQRSATWSSDRMCGLLAAISSCVRGSYVDWDKGVPERWGRVVLGHEEVAYVCARFPLAILTASAASLVEKRLQMEGVVIVQVVHMNAPELSVDKAQLESLFGGPLSDNIDYENLRASDLYFATVA